MDYTPISGRRVVLGFVLTALIAFLPLLAVSLGPVTGSSVLAGGHDTGYGWVVLAIGSVVGGLALAGLAGLAWLVVRRAARRPSSA